MSNPLAFIGSNLKWFVGQIPPNWNQYTKDGDWDTAWGNRVKVRIPGLHSKNGTELPDSDLPWAIVSESTTYGNLNSGSVGLIGGEWVTGYFLDSDSSNPQIPVINSVLPVNVGNYELGPSDVNSDTYAQSTEFKSVSRYCTYEPGDHQTLGGDDTKQPANEVVSSKNFEDAKSSTTS